MVAPIFAAIAGAIASIGVATLVRYGFWMVITYFVYDIANDLSDAHKINTTQEAERDGEADDTAKGLLEDGTWTKEEYLAYIKESSDAKEEENGSMLDQLARSFGLTKQTLIWIIVGILAFSLLKG
jgi:hypothetical protein